MIFETKRLIVRRLKTTDIEPFYELESNPKVLQYATGEVNTYPEAIKSLENVIDKYNLPNNDFWIYAVIRKSDNQFLGTVAIVKEENGDDELGYRFIERFWGNGYAFEASEGLINYCKSIGMPKLVGYAIDINVASVKILKRLNFKTIEKLTCKDTGLPETKYELIL